MILLEGVRNVVLPCSLALLVPGAIVTMVAGLRIVPTVAFVLGAGVVAWVEAVTGLYAWQGVAGGILLGTGFAVAAVLARSRSRWAVAAPVGALLGGGVAALLWEPCVGQHLGDVLTRAPDAPAGTLVPMVLYLVGLALPLLTIAGIASVMSAADAPPARWRRVVVTVGSALTVPVVGVLAVGVWDDVVGTLVRLSV